MSNDIDSLKFWFSAGFILLGSVTFQISALISGYNIYRELESVESAILSIAAGIIVFLVSPICFIIITPLALIKILDFNVLISFFSCAIGLGLVFGSVTILNSREIVMVWCRELLGLPLWVYTYENLWDKFFSRIRRGGKISIRIKNSEKEPDLEPINCLLRYYSIHKQSKMLVVENNKNNDWILIPGEKIECVSAPESSFNKHHESMGHLGQAVYCVIMSLGFFALSFSANISQKYLPIMINNIQAIDSINITQNYVQYILINENDWRSIDLFYKNLQYFFLLISIILLILSVLVARKDFNHWKSYLFFCPDFLFAFVSLLLTYISISLLPHETDFALFDLQVSIKKIVYLIILLLLIIYIFIIRNKLMNEIKDDFHRLVINSVESIDDLVLLKEIIHIYSLNLCLNNKRKSCIKNINPDFILELKAYGHPEDVSRLTKKFLNGIDNLKKNRKYIEQEDYNIIRIFEIYLNKLDNLIFDEDDLILFRKRNKI